MADFALLGPLFDQIGDHVADFGEGVDDSGKKQRGRRRKRDKETDVELKPGQEVVPDTNGRVGAIRIQKHLPLLKELTAFVLNNPVNAWVTVKDGIQLFLPTTFNPSLRVQQGQWVMDISKTPIKLKIKKTILGMTISYPTGLLGVSLTAAGLAVQLDNCPDLLISHTE